MKRNLTLLLLLLAVLLTVLPILSGCSSPAKGEQTTGKTETAPATEAATVPATSAETEAATAEATEAATESVTAIVTDAETEGQTVPATEPETETATEAGTEPTTEPETEAGTEPATTPETKPATTGAESEDDSPFLFEGPKWGVYGITGVKEDRRAELTVVSIPETLPDPETGEPLPVADLRSGCFAGCSNMTSLTIPATVETIGSGVFAGCDGLTEIKIYVTSPSNLTIPSSGLFDGASPSLRVYVPRGTLSVYGSNYTWANYISYLSEFDPE